MRTTSPGGAGVEPLFDPVLVQTRLDDERVGRRALDVRPPDRVRAGARDVRDFVQRSHLQLPVRTEVEQAVTHRAEGIAVLVLGHSHDSAPHAHARARTCARARERCRSSCDPRSERSRVRPEAVPVARHPGSDIATSSRVNGCGAPTSPARGGHAGCRRPARPRERRRPACPPGRRQPRTRRSTSR